MKFTLIVPYYRNPAMLARQCEEWNKYGDNVDVICVDDGSPEPAEPILREHCHNSRVRLLRITKDIAWNRGGARNLGAMQAKTDWILHVDIDHVLLSATYDALGGFTPAAGHWYRFSRYRVGAADFTRNKDDLDRSAEFGKIKPHMDSYLCNRDTYLWLGGYDEDYSGGLGGGTPFVRELQNAGTMIDLPEPYILHVHTTDSVPDASDIHLSRDTSRFKNLQKKKKNGVPKKPMCQFEWMEIGFAC